MKLNCIIFGSVCAVNLDRKEANSFLRNKRSNAGSWIFEEFKEGINLETSLWKVNFIMRIQNNLLKRERSSNKFNHFEGDLRRECYDEVCSYSEAMEAIEHVPSMIAFWGIHKVLIARI